MIVIRRPGLPPIVRHDDAIVAEIARLYREGTMMQKEIALRLGISRTAVSNILLRAGLTKAAVRRERAARRPPETVAPVRGGCRWVYGDPRWPGWHYCGKPLVRDRNRGSWCEEHARKVWKP